MALGVTLQPYTERFLCSSGLIPAFLCHISALNEERRDDTAIYGSHEEKGDNKVCIDQPSDRGIKVMYAETRRANHEFVPVGIRLANVCVNISPQTRIKYLLRHDHERG